MTTTPVKSIDWDALTASLEGIEIITDPSQVAKLSQDYHTFSPILQTLHARSVDTDLTYLQSLFPDSKSLNLVEQMYHQFGDEVMMHLEFIRVNGAAIPAALQLVRYSTEERLNEIIHYHEEQGVFIANPHTYIIEDGGRKQMDPEQLKFKQMVDPYELLNPGKIRALMQQ